MAKHSLKATQIRNLPEGVHSDGDGLVLVVNASGSKQWRQRFTLHGKRSLMGLGSVGGGVTLADARERSATIMDQVAEGIDPRQVKQKRVADQVAATKTFDDVAREYIEIMEPSWKNDKHAAQWKMTMLGPIKFIKGRSTDYCNAIHKKPIADIDIDDVEKILKPIWLTKPETGKRIRNRIEQVITYAQAKKLYTGQNPAAVALVKAIMPSQKNIKRGHFEAVSVEDLPAVYSNIQYYPGTGSLALQFAILTASRANQIYTAQWADIDINGALWVVPAEYMKTNKTHRVPLSLAALDLLHKVQSENGNNTGLIFRGRNGVSPISDATMRKVFHRLGLTATQHGTARSTFRDWAAEMTDFDPFAAEMALAHTIENKTEAAYRRGDLLEKRKPLMEAWGNYCLSGGDANGKN